MKTYKVTAKNGGRITLRSDDTFTLAFSSRGATDESTAQTLANCISLPSLKALLAKIERESSANEAAAYREGKLGRAIELASLTSR